MADENNHRSYDSTDGWAAPLPTKTDTFEDSLINEPDEAEDTSAHSAKTRTAGRPAGNKALVRRTASKVIEIMEAEANTVAVLAGLLSSKTEPVELTVAIMTADRTVTQPLKDIQAIRGAAAEDTVQAILTLNSAPRTQIKSMWQVLANASGDKGSMPTQDRLLVSRVFTMINELDSTQEALIEEATSLLRRA